MLEVAGDLRRAPAKFENPEDVWLCNSCKSQDVWNCKLSDFAIHLNHKMSDFAICVNCKMSDFAIYKTQNIGLVIYESQMCK